MSTKKETAEAEAPIRETRAAEKKGVQDAMYLGPSIVGVIRHSTVFKNGTLPQKAQECVEKLPMMEKLFVPLSDMPEAVKELNKPQSVLHTIYVQVAKEFS